VENALKIYTMSCKVITCGTPARVLSIKVTSHYKKTYQQYQKHQTIESSRTSYPGIYITIQSEFSQRQNLEL